MKKKVLIADDDNEMRDEISGILRDEGYEVKTAENGLEAMKLIKKQKFDVLLLDLKMPVMTGFEVLKELNENKIKLNTIVLTGSTLGSSLPDEDISNEEKMRILKLAGSVMNKPFDISRLLEKIKRQAE
jgi:CheY-like chemotaxis protein